MGWYGQWRPYVPVARRRAEAAKFGERLAKKEKRPLAPVRIEGRQIAKTFWGQAWMDNLEAYSDFANRLPRGRTYVRNGSVIDLVIQRGQIRAVVSGSDIYQVQIEIKTLAAAAWKQIRKDCANSIDSLLDLLSAKFDEGVMKRLTQPGSGLFPRPKEIEMQCSCPDWAVLCKHVAAVMYGIGARLDHQPELLFTLRDVDHTELIRQATTGKNLDRLLATTPEHALGSQDLGELFGIELERGDSVAPADAPKAPQASRRKATAKRADKSSPPRSRVGRRAVAGEVAAHPRRVGDSDAALPRPAKKKRLGAAKSTGSRGKGQLATAVASKSAGRAKKSGGTTARNAAQASLTVSTRPSARKRRTTR